MRGHSACWGKYFHGTVGHMSQAVKRAPAPKETTRPHLTPVPEDGDWAHEIAAWERHLKARDLSPHTVKRYANACRYLAGWAIASEGVTSPEDITAAQLEGYLAYRLGLSANAATTMAADVKCLRLFFKRVADVADIPDPMVKVGTPKPPEKEVPLYTDDDLRALLKVCAGREFPERRDLALIRILFDTGVRRAELVGLTLDSLNLNHQELTVLGKGRRGRTVTYGAKTAEALDRYLAARRKHPDAKLPNLWLAAAPRRGALGYQGAGEVIARRARQAGVDGAFLHRFRHTAADAFLAAGGQEGDAMRLFGWKARVMLDRYGAAGATRRALASHRQLSPGDRI